MQTIAGVPVLRTDLRQRERTGCRGASIYSGVRSDDVLGPARGAGKTEARPPAVDRCLPIKSLRGAVRTSPAVPGNRISRNPAERRAPLGSIDWCTSFVGEEKSLATGRDR